MNEYDKIGNYEPPPLSQRLRQKEKPTEWYFYLNSTKNIRQTFLLKRNRKENPKH